MNDMTPREILASTVYDLTSEVWGFKPDFSILLTWAEEQLQNEVEALRNEAEAISAKRK